MAGGVYTRVDHPTEINELLEMLCRPGGASLTVGDDEGTRLPVVVETSGVSDTLRLDISAIHARVQLAGHRNFRLTGRSRKGMVRSPPLTAQRVWAEGGRVYCECRFPEYFEKQQRRGDFRAKLRRGMAVRVDVYDAGTTTSGLLRDLSLHGCRVALEPSAAALMNDRRRVLQLDMAFPDGSHFTSRARPCHAAVEDGHILCGFHLEQGTGEHQRRLWFLVRETEREAARNAATAKPGLRPSPLFSNRAPDAASDANAHVYRTPMARRLAQCSGFLATQIVLLRQGDCVDSTALSRHAEQLLALLAQDREAVLFALACLHHELPLAQHCLAVAVRMSDIGRALSLPTNVCKALAAAGMVHDLGKALLPRALFEATHFDESHRRQLHSHVDLIKQRLDRCRWLTPVAIETVVEGVNERLDGSGYPAGRSAAKLHELMRLAAVVDVVDAMGRDRPDRAGVPVDRIYRHLLQSPRQFDPKWVKQYISHFGRWPVGTLLRFSGERLGWVTALDAYGRPTTIRQVTRITPADAARGSALYGEALKELGEPLEALPTPG